MQFFPPPKNNLYATLMYASYALHLVDFFCLVIPLKFFILMYCLTASYSAHKQLHSN